MADYSWLDDLHPLFRPPVVALLRSEGIRYLDLVFIGGWRDPLIQADLYAQGRTKPGKIVTWAKPGESPHNVTIGGKPASMAIDVAPRHVLKFEDWLPDDPVWAALGSFVGCYRALEWGGEWENKPDKPHIQLRHWRAHAGMRA